MDVTYHYEEITREFAKKGGSRPELETRFSSGYYEECIVKNFKVIDCSVIVWFGTENPIVSLTTNDNPALRINITHLIDKTNWYNNLISMKKEKLARKATEQRFSLTA